MPIPHHILTKERCLAFATADVCALDTISGQTCTTAGTCPKLCPRVKSLSWETMLSSVFQRFEESLTQDVAPGTRALVVSHAIHDV